MDCVYDERMLDMVPIWRDKGINKEPKDGLCLWRKNVRYGTDLERQRNKQRAEGWTVSMTKECYKEPKDGLCLWRKNVRYGTDLERQRNKQRAEGWTMSMTKADEKTIESAELWTMDQLDWELRSKYFERAEHHQTPRGSTRSCCAAQALLIWPYNKRRRVRTIIKCVIQGEVHGKRQRGRRKSNMTPCTQRQQRKMDWWKCGRNHGRLIVIPDGTAEEEEDWTEEQATSQSSPLRLVFVATF